MSAEEVYDRITTDLRRYRKLATLRGIGLGDVLGHPLPHTGEAARAAGLDDIYRRALSTGLAYHDSSRGLVPAGLVEEIRALDHPPLSWDAQLARWFEEHVPAVDRARTYARASRRQASTPDIPRPAWIRPTELQQLPTYGVVLDTSGSMDRVLLGKALGAIASYSRARDVPAARVIYCDAAAYDAGYIPVDDIAGRVQVRGRGGTVLQPGVDLLERADDFPATGPILLITDGHCDVVRLRRPHAWLLPEAPPCPSPPAARSSGSSETSEREYFSPVRDGLFVDEYGVPWRRASGRRSWLGSSGGSDRGWYDAACGGAGELGVGEEQYGAGAAAAARVRGGVGGAGLCTAGSAAGA